MVDREGICTFTDAMRRFYRPLSSLMLSLPMVSVTGFEPVVSWSLATRFAKLSYTLKDGGLYGN